MINLYAAATAFLLLHLLVSGTRLRDVLTGAIGVGAYLGLFSLASIAVLVWLGFSYAAARGGAGDVAYWAATPLTHQVQLVAQLVAMLLIVTGLTTRNPTTVGQEASLDSPDLIRGMLRITRHPCLWGVATWAAGHLLVNGDRASLVLFGALFVLALFGTASIDAKRKRVLGETWDAFAARTSNLPFAAIAAGRQSLRLGEIGWWRIALALAVWAGAIFAHPYAFGVSALN